MENKFQMSQEENIFLAKRFLVDAIYKSANLEGIAVTYANANDILNNVNVVTWHPMIFIKSFAYGTHGIMCLIISMIQSIWDMWRRSMRRLHARMFRIRCLVNFASAIF